MAGSHRRHSVVVHLDAHIEQRLEICRSYLHIRRLGDQLSQCKGIQIALLHHLRKDFLYAGIVIEVTQRNIIRISVACHLVLFIQPAHRLISSARVHLIENFI